VTEKSTWTHLLSLKAKKQRTTFVISQSDSPCCQPLQMERGVTKVVSHCCIDRYSNYFPLHWVSISIQHQQTLLKLHYALAKWNKSSTFNGLGSQKETVTPSGHTQQLESWSEAAHYDF